MRKPENIAKGRPKSKFIGIDYERRGCKWNVKWLHGRLQDDSLLGVVHGLDEEATFSSISNPSYFLCLQLSYNLYTPKASFRITIVFSILFYFIVLTFI